MNIVEESFRIYFQKADYWILYIVALIFLIWKRRELYAMNTIIWYSLCVFLIIINPLLAGVVGIFIHSSTEYVRLYYFLPVVFTIACAITLVIGQIKGRALKWCALLSSVVLIGFIGTSYYEKGQYIGNENIYKIPQEQKLIADVILEDLEDGETAYILGTFWDENWYYIRQYTSRIVGVGYSLQPLWYQEGTFDGAKDANDYLVRMEQNGIDFNYMIVRYESNLIAEYVEAGHDLLLETEGYAVFKVY